MGVVAGAVGVWNKVGVWICKQGLYWPFNKVEYNSLSRHPNVYRNGVDFRFHHLSFRRT
jgi:hypothetical protein